MHIGLLTTTFFHIDNHSRYAFPPDNSIPSLVNSPMWSQLPITVLSIYITSRYFQPVNSPKCSHWVKKCYLLYISHSVVSREWGFSDAHISLYVILTCVCVHSYLCEFLHITQKYEIFSTFFKFTGFLCLCGSLVEADVFVLQNQVFAHTLNCYGLSHVPSLVCSKGCLTAEGLFTYGLLRSDI